jgi:hypothetical protein
MKYQPCRAIVRYPPYIIACQMDYSKLQHDIRDIPGKGTALLLSGNCESIKATCTCLLDDLALKTFRK